MIKLRIFFIFFVLFLNVFLLHANEKETSTSNNNYFSTYWQKTRKSRLLSFNNNGIRSNMTNTTKYAAAEGGEKRKNGLIAGGAILTVSGVLLEIGGIFMTYLCAEGLGFFEDQKISVYFLNRDTSWGWLGLGLGITNIVLGSAILILGIVMIVLGATSGHRKQVSLFLESKPKTTALGFSFKLKNKHSVRRF